MAQAKVCMLTTEHVALDVRIFFKEARSLANAGYAVSVLSPLTDGSLVAMGGKKIGASTAEQDGVKLLGYEPVRALPPRLMAASRWLKLWSGGELDLLRSYDDLIAKGIELEADVYHAHEIDSLCAAFHIQKALRRKGKQAKVVYDTHEFSPSGAEDVKSRAIRQLYRGLIVRFERKAMERVDYAIGTNELQRGYLLSLNPFAHTEVIYNTPDLELAVPPLQAKPANGKFVLCYSGTLWFYRGLREMIEVLRLVKAQYGDNVQLKIIGHLKGAEKEYADAKIKEYGLEENFVITGWLPYSDVLTEMAKADLAVYFPTPTENDMMCTPNKLFEFMACGLPIVLTDVPGITYIVNDLNCGVIRPQRDIQGLSEATLMLMRDAKTRRSMGENGRKAALELFNWKQMEKRLVAAYRTMTAA